MRRTFLKTLVLLIVLVSCKKNDDTNPGNKDNPTDTTKTTSDITFSSTDLGLVTGGWDNGSGKVFTIKNLSSIISNPNPNNHGSLLITSISCTNSNITVSSTSLTTEFTLECPVSFSGQVSIKVTIGETTTSGTKDIIKDQVLTLTIDPNPYQTSYNILDDYLDRVLVSSYPSSLQINTNGTFVSNSDTNFYGDSSTDGTWTIDGNTGNLVITSSGSTVKKYVVSLSGSRLVLKNNTSFTYGGE